MFIRPKRSLRVTMEGGFKKGGGLIKFLDCLAIYRADMDKWPVELKKNMEQVFITSPELLEILKEEK